MSNQDSYKHISAQEFSKLDFDKVTLLDLREPDEVLVSGIENAVNLPFSGGFGKLDTVPKDKPVVVFCRVGDWSEQVAEILSDRGYDASTLDGGYNAYRKLLADAEEKADDQTNNDQAASDKQKKQYTDHNEALVLIDAKGLKCPGPIVKVADYLRNRPVGETIRVEATEDAFASDIRVWCDRTGNHLDELVIEEGIIKARITRADKKETEQVKEQNDKTFVIFSGDLDKTIAAFIIANGAAAMGRKVTMFFTFRRRIRYEPVHIVFTLKNGGLYHLDQALRGSGCNVESVFQDTVIIRRGNYGEAFVFPCCCLWDRRSWRICR